VAGGTTRPTFAWAIRDWVTFLRVETGGHSSGSHADAMSLSVLGLQFNCHPRSAYTEMVRRQAVHVFRRFRGGTPCTATARKAHEPADARLPTCEIGRATLLTSSACQWTFCDRRRAKCSRPAPGRGCWRAVRSASRHSAPFSWNHPRCIRDARRGAWGSSPTHVKNVSHSEASRRDSLAFVVAS